MRWALGMVAAMLAACGAGGPAMLAPPVTPSDSGRSFNGFGAAEQWTPIRLAAQSIPLSSTDVAEDRVGALLFRGGLELDSDDPRFGGLSGLYVDQGGKLLAVTDNGHWFGARIALDANGALIGLVDAHLAPIRDADGAVLEPKRLADAEDLARLPDGRFAVSFEQTHLVRLYDLAKYGPAAPASAEIRPGGTGDLRANQGFEAMAAFDDKLLLGGEEGASGQGAPFWLLALGVESGAGPVGRVTLDDRFGLSSLDRLPNGDFLALERFYAPLIGPRAIIRQLKAEGLGDASPRLDGAILASFGPGLNIDNFEGIAVAPGQAADVTRLYIVSDDNFRTEQRTLLLAFDLAADAP